MLGFINVYKPSGITSNAVVQMLKKKLNVKRIGHLGTLDPLACGVLPIAVGKATRLFDYFLEKQKRYDVVFDFGYTTDTLDTDGVVSDVSTNIPTMLEINSVIGKLIGKIEQMPPKFSAKNVAGRRAYEMARNGEDFNLQPKQVEIFEFELLEQLAKNKFRFTVLCSSGTYIRSLGRDLASLLGTYACMSFLERVESGVFTREKAISLEDLMSMENPETVIIDPTEVFSSYNIIEINDRDYKALRNGLVVRHDPIEINTFVKHNGKLIAVALPNKYQLKLDINLEE